MQDLRGASILKAVFFSFLLLLSSPAFEERTSDKALTYHSLTSYSFHCSFIVLGFFFSKLPEILKGRQRYMPCFSSATK